MRCFLDRRESHVTMVLDLGLARYFPPRSSCGGSSRLSENNPRTCSIQLTPDEREDCKVTQPLTRRRRSCLHGQF